MAGTLPDILRAVVASGDWSPVRARLALDAVLETSSETGRRRVTGAEAVLAHLSRPGPGAMHPAETAWGRAELAWWVPRVRTALERVGGAPG